MLEPFHMVMGILSANNIQTLLFYILHKRAANSRTYLPYQVNLISSDWDIDLMLEWANCTRFALTGAVFCRSPEHLERCSKEFRVGNLYFNRGCTGAIVERQPFGGFRMSGIGSKAGGPDYLLQFMESRTITENTIRREDKWVE
jgi:hypothetical protein